MTALGMDGRGMLPVSFSEAHFATFPPALIDPCILAGCPKGGTVFDPFGGAGTTGLVSDRLGRDAVTRRNFPDKVKAAAFLRADGRCEKCTARLYPGKFAYDHVIPDAMGGEPVLSNCEVLCTACHGEKTTKRDVPTIAKVKRIRAKHIGIKSTKRPILGGRSTPYKAKIGGGWERRT